MRVHQRCQAFQWGTDGLSTNGAGTTVQPQGKEGPDPDLVPHTQIISRWTAGLK